MVTWHHQTEICFWNPLSVSEALLAKEPAKPSPEWPFSKLMKLAVLDYTSSGRTGLIAADTEKQMKGKKKSAHQPGKKRRDWKNDKYL